MLQDGSGGRVRQRRRQQQQRSGSCYHYSSLMLSLLVGCLLIIRTAPQGLENVTYPPSAITTKSNSPNSAATLAPSSSPSAMNNNDDGEIGNPHCPAYTQGRYQYTPNIGPHPISCSNRSFYKWGPPEHEANACCSDEGRVAVQLAQVGGFDIYYKHGSADSTATATQRGSSSSSSIGDMTTTQQQQQLLLQQQEAVVLDYRCVAYTEALRAVLCDPRQYLMVHRKQNRTRLRVCQSSCNAVFQNCGLPGVNYPSFANYTDGTSLCEAAWGGWNTTPCQANDQQWACRVLDGLEIVNDVDKNDNSTDSDLPCLSIIYPTANTMKAYQQTMKPPDPCASRFQNGISTTTIAIIVIISILSVCLCGALLLKIAWNHRAAQERDML